MKASVFLKGYLSTFVLFWGAGVLFAITLALAVLEKTHYGKAQARWEAVQAEERKVRGLETFAASLGRYEAVIHRLASPREATVQERIALEPFEAFVEKLSRIYTDQGFFFLESFVLETCEEEKKTAASATPAECRPYAEVRGRKVYFQP
uniref:Uncharacterized protein n=1 Tax=Desulfacinum infernum TaxID=35837 RepID=A0A832EJR0_9BACT